MRELPTGIVTLLFTYIEGSTRMLQRVGEQYADVLETCHRLLRTALHGGQILLSQTTRDLVEYHLPLLAARRKWRW